MIYRADPEPDHALSRLPGIGTKTASRLAFYLLRAPPEDLAGTWRTPYTSLIRHQLLPGRYTSPPVGGQNVKSAPAARATQA